MLAEVGGRAEAMPMAERVAEFDWASTPLGRFDDWPPELKTVVRHILESRFAAAVIWGPGYTTIYNDAFRPILGNKPEALGRSFADIWSEAWAEIGPLAERAYNGHATYVEDFPLWIERFGEPEQAWFTFCYSPLRLSNGTVAGMIDTVVETTRNVKAKAELELLNQELGHRLKNTLALVQAIASQTFRDVSERDAVEAFNGRLAALGHAHQVLLTQDWAAASLQMVIRETLAPVDGLQQVRSEGPEMLIASSAAVTMSLLLHELATNAAKYGALSVPDGKVDLSWSVSDGVFSMHWIESGGPPVTEPTGKGFGSRLIARGLGTGGAARSRYAPSGYELQLEVPAQDLLSA
jgi:two-component sensor histidine kinase